MYMKTERFFLHTIICGFLIVLAIFISLQATGKIITVDDDGPADYSRIQYAVENSTNGDTIQVNSGYYSENIVINKQIQLNGENASTTIIDGVSHEEIVIDIQADGVRIQGFTITGGEYGIEVMSQSDVFVQDCFVVENRVGIFFHYYTMNCEIRNCTISNNEGSGIYLNQNTDQCNVSNNVIEENGYGISIQSRCRENNIRSCIIRNNTKDGIRFSSIPYPQYDHVIRDCEISNNSDIGIYIPSTTWYTEICGNRFINNSIFLEQTARLFEDNYVNGKPLYYGNEEDSKTIDGDYGAIILKSSSNITISNMAFSHCDYGITLIGSRNCTIENVTFKNSTYGVYDSSYRTNISHSSFEDSGYGIFEVGSQYRVIHNRFIHNEYGANLEYPVRGGSIIRNVFEENRFGGLAIEQAEDIHIENNSFVRNGIEIKGHREEYYLTHHLHNNSMNGKPFLLLHDEIDREISTNEYGQIIFYNCTNVTIRNINISYSGGLILAKSQNCVIKDSILSWNSGNGISFVGAIEWKGKGIRIENCTVSNNSRNGIYIPSSYDGEYIINCTIRGNSQNGIEIVSSDNNEIERCDISKNMKSGLLIRSGSQNTIVKDCSIENNIEYGIDARHFSSQPVFAENNWWGHDSGPFHESENPAGSGGNISVEVQFSPWRTTPLNHFPPVATITPFLKDQFLSHETINISSTVEYFQSIILYCWNSSIDGELYCGDKSHFSSSNLSIGDHSISLRVMDNFGIWSQIAYENLTIVLDSDFDGFPDETDEFPFDPDEWADLDHDGVGDNSDRFPDDPAASIDTDDDGYPNYWNLGNTKSDSTTGLERDKYPDDPTKWKDEEEENGNGDGDGLIPGFELILLLMAMKISLILHRKR
jgi:parallel beta-helix repeat protein